MNRCLYPYACCTVYKALLAFLFVLSPTSFAYAADLTADEIMMRSKEAMRPPIRYRMISQGTSTLVCQKVLSDGITATRLETSSPVTKISFVLDKLRCDFYPDLGVGIDTSFMIQQPLTGQAAAASELGSDMVPDDAQVKSVVTEDGRECFEVSMSYPSNITAAITNALPDAMKKKAQTIVPSEARMVVERKTFLMVEARVMSQVGLTISRTEYQDIEQTIDLDDNLFLPPDGLNLLKPQGIPEYVTMLSNLLRSKPMTFALNQKVAAIRTRPSLPVRNRVVQRPEIDPQTGHITRPLSLEMSQEAVDRRSANRMLELHAAKDRNSPSNKRSAELPAPKGWMKGWILGSLLLTVFLTGVVCRHRLMKAMA